MKNLLEKKRIRKIKIELKNLCSKPVYKELDSWRKDTIWAYISGKSHFGDEQGQLRIGQIDKSGLCRKNVQDLWRWDLFYILEGGELVSKFLEIDKYEKRNEDVLQEMCGL